MVCAAIWHMQDAALAAKADALVAYSRTSSSKLVSQLEGLQRSLEAPAGQQIQVVLRHWCVEQCACRPTNTGRARNI
jgi:hypothetical protein